jgi:hypothetical protein
MYCYINSYFIMLCRIAVFYQSRIRIQILTFWTTQALTVQNKLIYNQVTANFWLMYLYTGP